MFCERFEFTQMKPIFLWRVGKASALCLPCFFIITHQATTSVLNIFSIFKNNIQFRVYLFLSYTVSGKSME
jgi:hypothetical protein